MNVNDFDSLYTAEQTRALDASAINTHGIPGFTLMSRAAAASYEAMKAAWPEPEFLQVLCGSGNNGGDGYLVADLARKRGTEAVVYTVGDVEKITGDARLARDQALSNGVIERPYRKEALEARGVIVDAMLGTGLGGDVRGDFAAAIEEVNALGLPVMAVDIPSGLCADTGRVLGVAVQADLTVSFIGLKRGLFTLDAPDYVGELHFAGLGVPDEAYNDIPASCIRLDLDTQLASLPHRAAASHKGSYGSVLVIGGDLGMGGAGLMAAESALRCGAGLVRLATRVEHVAAAVSRVPEVMTRGIQDGHELLPMIEACDVLVVGPGLGQSDWSKQVLLMAHNSGKPLVLDADGLNLLAGGTIPSSESRPDRIITPHPGEAARLLDSRTADVQQDRFAAASALQSRYGGVVILKGNGSIVSGPDHQALCDYGNPGMASGGMGDVLSGVLGALIAQGIPAFEAAALGTSLHAAAADIAALDGERGLVATDLIPVMRDLLG